MPDISALGMRMRAGAPTTFYGSRLHRGAAVFGCFAVGTLAAGGTTYATDPWTAQWPDFVSSFPTQLSSAVKAAGLTTIRLAIDPTPFLLAMAAGDMTRFSALMVKPLAAVDLLAQSFAVIWDMHVRPDPNQITGQGTSDAEIVQSTSATANYAATCAKIAAVLAARYSRGQVAMELFNEPPFYNVFTGQSWPVILMTIWRAVRAVAPTLTLLYAGTNYGATGAATNQDYSGQTAYGLCALNSTNIGAILLDPFTIAVVHDYEPLQATFQAESGQGYSGANAYISNLPYPPVASAYAAALAQAKSYVAADLSSGTITSSQASGFNTALTTDLRAYFGMDTGVPMDGAWMLTNPKGMARVAAWADGNGIARNRINVSEFGCDDGTVGSYQGRPGAGKPSKLAYLKDRRTSIERFGFSWSQWSLQGLWSGIRICDANNNLDPDFAAALFTPS